MPQALSQPLCPVRRLVSAYTVPIIPDDMSIPSSASLAYRGGAMQPFTQRRGYGVLGSSQVRAKPFVGHTNRVCSEVRV